MASLVHNAVQGLASITAAVATTGVQAHAGYLELAKLTNALQSARFVPKPLQARKSSSAGLLASRPKPVGLLRQQQCCCAEFCCFD